MKINMTTPEYEALCRKMKIKPITKQAYPEQPLHRLPEPKDKLNKTETEYLHRLQKQYPDADIKVQAMKFQIGEERCWYTPDFDIFFADGHIEIHETKGGFYRDDARVKFQAAKLMYKGFVWKWCQKKEGVWIIQ